MPPPWLGAVVFLVGFFVLVPVIAALIGWAAWKGKPKGWDRSTYWTAFVASMIASIFLITFAQRMQADVREWQYVVQMAFFGLGILLLGVAVGCGVGIFAYQRGRGPVWRGTAPAHESERPPETSRRNDNPPD